ncbi:hypothetical protein [Glycomyces terrestris]|uniref:Uncharacterized protein n=1 Tax=Glycomyces terrestris TaxID=2493553 RepID=A0A426UVI5_9ACTN|nr:hypothetical protein [Glycomyces terrestris]RRR98211.1 hypothetical protein EIW28_14935 [Glycomyces terrestris]
MDDEVGDGELTSTGRGFPVLALLGHADGILHTLTWQGPAGAWTATERVQIKLKLAEVLSNRDQFQLGGMRFRPHKCANPVNGQTVVYVYRTDIYPEVLVAVAGSGGLALTPEHRYLDAVTLGRATEECLAGRTP